MLAEEPVEVLDVVACRLLLGEVAVLRAGLADLQVAHDRRLAGVDADGVEPAGDGLVLPDRDLRGRAREGVALAALALDREHSVGLPRSAGLIDLLSEVTAGVDQRDRDPQAPSVLELVDVLDDVIQPCPDLRRVRAAHNKAALDAPALAVLAMTDHLVLEAVVLRVDAHGEHEHAVGQLHGGAVLVVAVVLAAGEHGVLVSQISALLPELAEEGVPDDLQAEGVVLRFEEGDDDLAPRCPRRGEGVQPEGPDAGLVGLRVSGDPFRRLLPHGLLGDQAAAFRADP